jgi:hypothetical protein
VGYVINPITTPQDLQALVTHPSNLTLDTIRPKQDPPAMRGAGTALVDYLIRKVSLPHQLSVIELTALQSSIEFYRKMGFACLHPSEEDTAVAQMVLTVPIRGSHPHSKRARKFNTGLRPMRL